MISPSMPVAGPAQCCAQARHQADGRLSDPDTLG
jgi:hypothetical protein